MKAKSLTRILLATAVAATLAGCVTGFQGSQEMQFEAEPVAVMKVPTWLDQGMAFDTVDWNRDGNLDYLVGEPLSGEVHLYCQKEGQFYKSEEAVFSLSTWLDQGMAFSVVDWDKDGDYDVLAAQPISGDVILYINDSGDLGSSDCP